MPSGKFWEYVLPVQDWILFLVIPIGGLFLERPGNFSGLKGNFKIKPCWIGKYLRSLSLPLRLASQYIFFESDFKITEIFVL